MIGGKDWLDLIVVSAVALGFLTLMIVIQALQNERSRGEIIRGVSVVWGAVAATLLLAWLLEGYWGGALIDVQVWPRPDVVTRPLTGTQGVVLTVMMVALLGLYVTAVLTVRKLIQPREAWTIRRTSEADDGSQGDPR